jgi:hypothetical protein
MIAGLGAALFAAGRRDPLEIAALPSGSAGPIRA